MTRATIGLPVLLFALAGTGCVQDGAWKDWSIENPFSSSAKKMPDGPKMPPGSLQAAERVDTLGRRIIAQNTFTGLEPLFHTVGVKEPMLFHRGTAELFISEGLVERCKSEQELAAVLCSELGRMMAEQKSAGRVGRDADPIPDVPATGGNRMAGGMDSDQTRAAELVYFEKRNPRRDPATGSVDSAKLARELLTGAGFNPAELARVEPLIKQAEQNDAIRKQMAGPAPAPSWGR